MKSQNAKRTILMRDIKFILYLIFKFLSKPNQNITTIFTQYQQSQINKPFIFNNQAINNIIMIGIIRKKKQQLQVDQPLQQIQKDQQSEEMIKLKNLEFLLRLQNTSIPL
ncbi:unnamed protein product [Paramecium sonneborni]|uniref:Uncharacterized protein n=1 Tax=Paramecium sonneborni TaxID=65129 RepID=A0A8S1Q0H7_9CILI|nr:unnamed protein product [Paramecium sonneborni]